MAYDKKKGEGSYGKRESGAYNKGPRQDKPYKKDGDKPGEKSGVKGKPYPADRQDRPYRKDDRPGKPFPADRQDKPYRKVDRPGKPFPADRQDRPYRKDDRPGKPFPADRQDKPYRKDDRPGKPFPADRQDRPYRKDDRPDGSFEKRPRTQWPEQEQRNSAPMQESVPQFNAEDELPYLVMGRNAVREALKSGRSIDRILVVREPDGSLREILGMARDNNVQIREVERGKLDELCMPFGHGGKSGNHQGIVAQVPGVEYCEISDILNVAKERGEAPFIILLDGIEDPHNLGSILRSAECAGAHGVIIPKRRSASVTASACKASAGATEYVKVARVVNLSGAIERLKKGGVWIAGADMKGTPMEKVDMKGALGLVIGSESSGISTLVKEKCDFLVSIPLWGKMDSLNAAVAAAVLMFEKKRQG